MAVLGVSCSNNNTNPDDPGKKPETPQAKPLAIEEKVALADTSLSLTFDDDSNIPTEAAVITFTGDGSEKIGAKNGYTVSLESIAGLTKEEANNKQKPTSTVASDIKTLVALNEKNTDSITTTNIEIVKDSSNAKKWKINYNSAKGANAGAVFTQLAAKANFGVIKAVVVVKDDKQVKVASFDVFIEALRSK